MTFNHIPILRDEVIQYMCPAPGETFLDGTLGGAGHTRAFLEKITPGGRLIGVDQDPAALENAEIVLAPWKEQVTLVHDNFGNLKEIVSRLAPEGVDGIFLDIGVSSPQIDTPERGFSYMHNAPLDMRMDPTKGKDAAFILNHYSQEELHQIIRRFGEEKWAKRIAEFIVAKRASNPLVTTGDLVAVIEAAIPKAAREKGSHPAKRTFQAIRIAVNRELDVLENAIEGAMDALKTGGRLGIITFHSLEDRIVKEKFNFLAKDCICPPEFPVCSCNKRKEVEILTRKPIIPSKEEMEANPRSKSAKLRVIKKI